jgi:hypothetical protein
MSRAKKSQPPQLAANDLPELTALQLEQHVSPKEAAKIKGISPATLKRHYPHIFRKASPRRDTIKLRDLLSAQPRNTVCPS